MSGASGNKIIRQAVVRSARTRTSKVAEGSEDILLNEESGSEDLRKFRYMPEILNGNPVIQFLFKEMHRQRMCQMDMSERIGLHRDTLRNWRTRYNPRITDVEAALNVLGYTLKAVKKRDEADG